MNPSDEKEKALWRLEKYNEIKAELQNNEKLREILEQTYPESRAEFINDYANKKVDWLEWGPKYIEWMEQEDLQWVNDATERLKEIQQKKLFDVQCLWRAEKIVIPEIMLTYDFRKWERNIFNCPFIEPVSEEELDMYIAYLESPNFEEFQGFFDSWQDYDEIKAAYNSENADRNFPDWYDFHNGRTGLAVYMLLPDIRGEKENVYLKLWADEVKKKTQEPAKPAANNSDANTDKRPWLNYHQKGWLSWFVKTFEDKETQQMFEKYGGETDFDSSGDYEIMSKEIEYLGKADRIMPVEAHYDWREAIYKAAANYRKEKIAEALPIAFQRYRINVDLGISFPYEDTNINIFNWYPEAILRGRELAGEPRDFDF